MDALGKPGAGKSLPNAVVADIRDLAQSIEQAECMKDGSINADADGGVARFDLLQGRAGSESALRYDCHRQSPTTAGVVDVRAKLAQGALGGSRRTMRCRHVFFVLQINGICSTKLTIYLDRHAHGRAPR